MNERELKGAIQYLEEIREQAIKLGCISEVILLEIAIRGLFHLIDLLKKEDKP